MKARMKKIQLMLHHGEKAIFLQKLQELGLVHLEMDEQNISPANEALITKRENLQKTMELLAKQHENEDAPSTDLLSDADEVVAKANELISALEKTDSELETLKKELAIVTPWGNFDTELITKLKQKNILTRFYIAAKKGYDKYDFANLAHEIITLKNGMVYFVVFLQEDTELPFDRVILPSRSIDQINAARHTLQQKRNKDQSALASLSKNIPLLDAAIIQLNNEIFYHQASDSFHTAGENTIHYIQGWIPKNALKSMTSILDKQHIAYLVRDADLSDEVPVILKNKKYPKVFETITNVFELPNYRELDLTPVIAVFYPIFFAYCLGDSGYGLVFVALFVTGYFTFLKNNKIIAALGAILGAFTMVIGILKSGTIFGIPIAEHRDMPFFDFFAQYIIIPDSNDVTFNAFNVALILGIVQIIVGVLSAIIKSWIYDTFEASLAPIGKLIIIISTVTLFLGTAQEMQPFAAWAGIAKYTLGIGILLVLLFNNIRLPIFKRIGSGILPIYFIFTGLLGDTLSYIRLFALGISSGILGLVINNIGGQIMSGGTVGIIIGIVFLIFGHLLNLFISGLGSFVHPLRLTFVEFYNNAEFKGGGIPFHPFKKETFETK